MKTNKKETRPEIIETLLKENNKIVEMKIRKVVRKLGDSGFVSVPRELIGKYISIHYVMEKER